MRQLIVIAALAVASAIGQGVTAVAQPLDAGGTRVMLLYDEDPSLPGLVRLDQSLRATFTAALDRVEFYRESLSLSQFEEEQHEDVVRRYFAEKYRDRQPQLIVAIMGPTLQFLLRHGEELFPGVPIVFCGADVGDIAGLELPSNVTGVLVRRAFAPTLDLALRLHPATTHVYVVGGTSPFDEHLLMRARGELQPFESRLTLEYLTDLPMTDILARVKTLPPNSLVLYLSLFRDAAGDAFVPHDAAATLAETANAPVYVFVDQFVGRGPVGGVVYSIASHGVRAGQIALRLLRGTPAATIPVMEFAEAAPMFDARQLERWRIDTSRLPRDALVQWQDASLWRDYRKSVVTAVSIGVVLVGLVVGLLYERRERRRAELRAREQLTISSHLGRQSAMGEMATALAHELNQPLGAIRLNVATAQRMLGSAVSAGPLREILQEIEREDVRASQIIERQRDMLRKRDPDHRHLDLNEVVRESAVIVAHEAELRRVRFDLQLSETPCAVIGDRVLLEQVMVNLLVNAMDAMADTADADRIVTLQTAMTRNGARVSVSDRGAGLADAVMGRLFQPFLTTKAKGMGIGLSIVRGIVEAHGGTIQAANNPQGGATFSFTLPVIDGTIETESVVSPLRRLQGGPTS